MPVIKGASSSLPRDTIVLDFGDLARQGEAILERARREADRILAEARAEAARLVAGAEERGYREGFERGIAEGREEGVAAGRAAAERARAAELDALLASWTGVIDGWERDTGDMLQRAREDLVGLAIAIASRLVRRIIDTDVRVAAAQVEAALELAARSTHVRIRVNPQDAAEIDAMLPDLRARTRAAARVEIVADPAIDRGGTVLRTDHGEIDARLETQLARITRALCPGAAHPGGGRAADMRDEAADGEPAP